MIAEPLEPRWLMSAPGNNWKLVWADEFNGNHLDASKWTVGLPWQDGPIDSQSDSDLTPNNVSVSSGQLHLTTQRQTVTDSSGHTYQYTSGLVTSYNHFEMSSGYVEVSVQVPAGAGQGLWPAFWLSTNVWPPEDDVAEFSTTSNRLHQGLAYGTASNVHWDDTNSSNPLPTGFHTYGMEWGPNYQIFYQDGLITHVVRGSQVPTIPMFFVLDSGVEVASDPSNTVFPNSFDVDYVRVYQRNGSPSISNGNFEGGALGLWQAAGNASVVSTNALSGNYSLQLEGQGSQAQETITGLNPNTTYVISATAEASPGNQATVGVSGFGSSDVTATVNSSTPTPVTLTFTTGRGKTTAVVYGLQSSGTGTVLLDDFDLHRPATIENPSFDLAGLAGWNAAGSVSAVALHPVTGALVLQANGPSAVAQQTLYGLLPNTTYRLTGWARVSSPDTQAAIGLVDPAGTQAQATTLSTRWRPLTLLFTTGSSTTANLFCTQLVGPGSAWFDNLHLTPARKTR